MRMTALALLASAGAVSACEPQAPAASADETTLALDGEEVTIEIPPMTEPSAMAPASNDGATPDAQPTLLNPNQVNAADFAEDRAALTAIPARFLGRWGAVEAPCDPGSDMQLTIRPGTIAFHESEGEVTGVRRGRPGIVVTLAMQDEGGSWTSEYAMKLVGDGVQLATLDVSDPGTATTRRRCLPRRPAAQAEYLSPAPAETAPRTNAPVS